MRLIVFDCDGTLVDSQATIVGCTQAAFIACGLEPPSNHAVRRIVGLSLQPAMVELLGRDDPDLGERITEAYRHAFFARRAKGIVDEDLFEGIAELLAELARRQFLLGVATGKSMAGLERVLRQNRLTKHFHTLQTADLHPSKPHPSMLQAAMEECGAMPNETMLVGDTTFDVDMARAAGAMAIGVSWGNHPTQELVDAGAHTVIDRAEQILDLLPAQ